MGIFGWLATEESPGINRFLTPQEIFSQVSQYVDSNTYEEYLHIIKIQFMFDLEQDGRFPYPLEMEFIISSEFGERPNPTGTGVTYHHGIDLVGTTMYAPICSISDGEVVAVSTKESGLGNYVVIKYRERNETFYGVYGHLSGILVNNGDDVDEGEIIGTQGGNPNTDPNSGNTTGSHLHFEIRKNPFSSSSSVDPAEYIM